MKSFYRLTQYIIGTAILLLLVAFIIMWIQTPTSDPGNSREWMGMAQLIGFYCIMYLLIFIVLSWIVRPYVKNFRSIGAGIFTVFQFIIAGIPGILVIFFMLASCFREVYEWVHGDGVV